jgi:hypothetical protein
LGANAAERQILGGAKLVVFAVAAYKVFVAAGAGLKKNYFRAKYVADCIDEVLDVVAAFDGVNACVAVVAQTRVYQGHKLFFFNPRKLKRLLIQNHHSCSEPVHFN